MKVCTCMVVSTGPCEAHPLPAAPAARLVIPAAAIAAIDRNVNDGFVALAAAATLLTPDPVDYAKTLAAIQLVYHALAGVHEILEVVMEENGHGS